MKTLLLRSIAMLGFALLLPVSSRAFDSVPRDADDAGVTKKSAKATKPVTPESIALRPSGSVGAAGSAETLAAQQGNPKLE